MILEKTSTFSKDIKHLDKPMKRILKERITDMLKEPERFKPLLHYKNIRSAKIGGKRLLYQYLKNENKIILLMFKSRDGVYDYLRDPLSAYGLKRLLEEGEDAEKLFDL
jgi:mRNA-degrading endonuclease RelE of RelBE toxin-antitoxin system